MLTHRIAAGLLGLGLSIAAVPAAALAHSHYTGRVPASIAGDPLAAATDTSMDGTMTPARTPAKQAAKRHRRSTLARRRLLSAAAKHAGHRKHRHHRARKAKPAM